MRRSLGIMCVCVCAHAHPSDGSECDVRDRNISFLAHGKDQVNNLRLSMAQQIYTHITDIYVKCEPFDAKPSFGGNNNILHRKGYL